MIPRRRGQVRRIPTSGYDIGTELALVLFSLAVVYSFKRLFEDTSFFVPIAAVAVSAHVLSAAVRWARGGLVVSAAVSFVGFIVTTWLLFPPTTLEPPVGFDRVAVDGYLTDLELAMEQFQSVASPAEVTAPFLLLIAIVMWVVAFLSDWAAFRLRAPGEALIPGVAVFVFGAFFSAQQSRVETSVAMLATGLLLVLFHRLAETSTAGAWLGAGAAEKGQASMLRVGAAILAVTLVGGISVAQALPGYNEPPIAEQFDPSTWNDTEEPRVVLSPLVDIRSRLINQPDVEVFTVASPVKDYWRITSLDVFDGRIWRSRGSFEGAAGELDTDLPDGTAFEAVTQSFDINRLGEIWLPAAYEPTEVLSAPDDVELEYEPQSGTLIVNRETENSDGLKYTLLSAVPTRDRNSIANAGGDIPGDIAERYLELPDDFSDRVRAQAAEIVEGAGANTPYEQALALQNFFRDPSLFSYSLDVSKGHGSSRIEDFLFEVRAGYCEQFAGSYAAMARSIGLPARVAVGFTPGDYDESIDAYRVNGKHAHAWPEVWIKDIGWLRFEPTPGRGAPRDEAYTGQSEAQEGATVAPETTTTVPEVNPNELGPNATTIPSQQSPASPTTTIAPTGERASSGIIGGARGLSAKTIFTWLAGFSGLVLLFLSPLAYGAFRARRRHQAVAHDPRRRIGLAWAESKSALQVMGLKVVATETPRELVARVSKTKPVAAEALQPLATEVTNVTYAGGAAIDADRADKAEKVTASLASQARSSQTRTAWWWRHINPINVWRDKVGTWKHLRG